MDLLLLALTYQSWVPDFDFVAVIVLHGTETCIKTEQQLNCHITMKVAHIKSRDLLFDDLHAAGSLIFFLVIDKTYFYLLIFVLAGLSRFSVAEAKNFPVIIGWQS